MLWSASPRSVATVNDSIPRSKKKKWVGKLFDTKVVRARENIFIHKGMDAQSNGMAWIKERSGGVFCPGTHTGLLPVVVVAKLNCDKRWQCTLRALCSS